MPELWQITFTKMIKILPGNLLITNKEKIKGHPITQDMQFAIIALETANIPLGQVKELDSFKERS